MRASAAASPPQCTRVTVQLSHSFGTRCAGGLNMLLYQGARAFELWTGKKAPVEVMREALMKEKS